MSTDAVSTRAVNEKAKVRKIQTFTAEYSPAEDRVRFNCVDSQGAAFGFWITRRLLSNVVAASVSKIEQAVSKTEAMERSQTYSANLNQLEQQVARQQKSIGPKVKPVKMVNNSDAWLCHSVNIVTLAEGFNLQFRSEEGLAEIYTMALSEADYRNVLDILFRTYSKAGWSIRAFPTWLVSSKQTAKTVSLLN